MKNNYGLSDVELYDCEQVFNNFDKDNSNSIDLKELGTENINQTKTAHHG